MYFSFFIACFQRSNPFQHSRVRKESRVFLLFHLFYQFPPLFSDQEKGNTSQRAALAPSTRFNLVSQEADCVLFMFLPTVDMFDGECLYIVITVSVNK